MDKIDSTVPHDETAQERMLREARDSEASRQPGVVSAAFEILELAARFALPIVNLAILTIRLLVNVVYAMRGRVIDWHREGWRLAGDLAGCVFAPLGALANVSFNLAWDQSQIAGGINELFRQPNKHDPFRYGAKLAWRWVDGR
jgi:hypothetical protein